MMMPIHERDKAAVVETINAHLLTGDYPASEADLRRASWVIDRVYVAIEFKKRFGPDELTLTQREVLYRWADTAAAASALLDAIIEHEDEADDSDPGPEDER
jgi:hypothetical protein